MGMKMRMRMRRGEYKISLSSWQLGREREDGRREERGERSE